MATPDYHLLMTGKEVEAALNKINKIDFNNLGGYIKLESTSDNPANVDSITEKGQYYADYVTSNNVTFPNELKKASPVYINYTVNTTESGEVLVKIISANGNNYMSWSTNGGTNWSDWVKKPDNSTRIPPELDPDTHEPKSEIGEVKKSVTQLQTDLTNLSNQVDGLGASLALGTEEDATAMLNGIYDYGN